MPSSPVTKTIDVLPENWKEKEKVIIPDDNTVHYYRVGFTNPITARKPYAWLECCYIDEDVLDEERWYQVEEMTEEHKSILDTIKAVLGISFHDKIGV